MGSNYSPQLIDSEPAFFNFKSKSPVVLVLADVEAGDIDSVGWSVTSPPNGVAECCKRGVPSFSVLVNDVDGVC